MLNRKTINIGDTGEELITAFNDNFIETFSGVDRNTYLPADGETFNVAVTNAAEYENIYINGAMLLTGNITTTKNLIFQRGSTLGGAFTLTHTGYIIAGYYQIFEPELIVAGYNANKLIIVDWWGVDNTGIADNYQSFYKAWVRMGPGFTMKISQGYYRIITEHHNPGLRNDCVYDYNNSVITCEAGNYLGFGNYDTQYAFDTNPFAEDFVKGSNYIVINDKSEWEALTYWGEDIKIGITTTEIIHEATSDYYDSLCIDIDRLETVEEEDRMYFKYPCPRDFKTSDETYPLRQYNDKVVRYWNLTRNVQIKNLKLLNGSISINNVFDLKIDNVHLEVDEDNFNSYDSALSIIQCDLININNFTAKNYHKNGYGDGIVPTNTSRVVMNNLKITDCRHSISIMGGYTTSSFMVRINNIELISTGKLNAGNNIDAHGNLIDFIVDGVRAHNCRQVFSSRSGIGIVRNVYAENCASSPFYFSGSAAIDYSKCGVQNAIIINSQLELIEMHFDVEFAFFDNIHCVTDAPFIANDATVGTIVINNCTRNHVPIVAGDIVNEDGGTIDALYINNILIE